jgi:hypothetical protein
MVLSKLDLALMAVIAVGLLWIEHEHRVIIGTPAAAEGAPPAASVCPASDDVPFSADCIAFIGGGASLYGHGRTSAAAGASAVTPDAERHGDPHGPPCPASNEDAPYTARCLRFLSGWYWQANPPNNAP